MVDIAFCFLIFESLLTSESHIESEGVSSSPIFDCISQVLPADDPKHAMLYTGKYDVTVFVLQD